MRLFSLSISSSLVAHPHGFASLSPGYVRKSHVYSVNKRQRWRNHFTLCNQLNDSEEIRQSPWDDKQSYWKLPRLYVGSARLASNTNVKLSSEQTHYLTKVMRFFKKRKHGEESSAKDCVRLFNGKDGEWLAKVNAPSQPDVENDNRKRRSRQRNDIPLEAECLVELREPDDSDIDRPWIIFAPIKNQARMKLMIEKCTELGVGAIVFAKSDRMDGSLMSSNSQSGSNSNNLDDVYGQSREDDISVEKLKLQAIEASEQCERLTIPYITADLSGLMNIENEVSDILTVKDIIKLWCSDSFETNNKSRKLLICRERGEQSTDVVPVLSALQENERVAFVVGPEGGWSQEEEDVFDAVCTQHDNKDTQIQCVSLGSSVLRAETACIMAVGAWSLIHR